MVHSLCALGKPYCVTRDDVIKWRHFPSYRPFVRGIHRWPVNSPNKGQWRGVLVFSLICAWINAWVNNREAGRHLIVRSCKVSKPRILYSELCDYSKIWLESRQYCCQDAYRTPNRHDDLNYQSHSFETSRNVRWCIGYWNRPLAPFPKTNQF